MNWLSTFALINVGRTPAFVYRMFRGHYIRMLLKLALGIQYPHLKLKAIQTKGLRLPTELQVVGYSAWKVYYIEEGMLCGVDWKHVELPTLEEYFETLLAVKEWTRTEEYRNTMTLMSWLNVQSHLTQVKVKERDGHRIFTPSAGFCRDQHFVKNMLMMKAHIFMFVFPEFTHSYAYLPKDVEILIDKAAT